MQSPPHLQRAVHGSSAFTHVHLCVQPLHPQRNSSRHACVVSGRFVQPTLQPFSFLTKPHCSGEGSTGTEIFIWTQQWPAWYVAIFVCWISDARVGGRQSIPLAFWQNGCFLDWLIQVWLLVRSYSKITNRSSGSSHSSIDAGVDANAQNAGVTSLNTFHVSHAVLFLYHQSKTQYHTQWRHGT